MLDKPLKAPAWWIGAAVAVLALGAYLWLKPARLPEMPLASARALAVPAVPPPAPKLAAAPAEQVLDEETIAWETLKQLNGVTPQQIDAFLKKYPNGPHAEVARTRLAEQGKSAENVAAAAKPAEAKAADPTGVVLLTIKPWGKVLVDGSIKGVSPPLKKLVLAEGKHQIKVVNPSFPDRVFEIDVSPKKSRNIDYDFSSH